jgi:uncharacterized protein YbjT (DUF2867 family)
MKTIAVVGATGAQGGGLARAILADPARAFRVRALTRNPASEKAQALARAGAEVVAFDIDDPQSVRRGFAGAAAAYCVTFFWDHFSPEKEGAHARSMAEAARAAGIEHVIWSTFEDTRLDVPLSDDRMPTLMGHYKVPHFDSKGESDRFFADLPVTYLLTSFYWDNLINFGMGPKRAADGQLEFILPMGDKKLPGIAAEDIGRCALGIFHRGSEFRGKRVGIAGGHLTGTEMAASLTRALGELVRYNAVPPPVYRGFPFPGAADLGNMFQYKQEFEAKYCGARSLEVSRSLNPALLSFDSWLAQNKARLTVG